MRNSDNVCPIARKPLTPCHEDDFTFTTATSHSSLAHRSCDHHSPSVLQGPAVHTTLALITRRRSDFLLLKPAWPSGSFFKIAGEDTKRAGLPFTASTTAGIGG